MPGLSIESVDLEVQSFQAGAPRQRGEVSASFNNTLRSSVSDEQPIFTAVTAPLDSTELAALQAAIANSTPVDVSGDCLGAETIECIVTMSYELQGAGTDSFEFVATLQMQATGN